ncbi:helix-turn-helix transcriptional regulator [Clostridium minihomine]|uniref:helix-turn-helix transcriptional regulator n=1 Tax=Clostridium minihomine TaxID=2045012 RepID=UPI000C75B566|nr:helix-turn-helix transcriptional regulator [Clostridium minihomine]
MISESIKSLRQRKNFTQADLARNLNVTRSSVNAWEMGISIPSTQMITELSLMFGVSSDYLLGIKHNSTIDISGLTDKEVGILVELINTFKENRR